MSLDLYLTFFATCVVLALTPGPTMSLIIGNSTSHGTPAGLYTVAGNTLGLSVLVAIAVLGMTSIMSMVAAWFDWIRWLGAAYLIWLGAMKLRHSLKNGLFAPLPAKSRRHFFRQGFIGAMSNPKVLLFLGAFFPQFVDAKSPLGPQFAVLAVTFVVALAAVDSSYAVMAGSARRWFDARRQRLADRVSGIVLIAAGTWLALARRT